MTSPGHCVFRGLVFVLQEQVYLAVNKSHLMEEPAEPVTAPPRARKRNRLTHSFSERQGKHTARTEEEISVPKKIPSFNYPKALFLVTQGQANAHLFPPGANPQHPLGPSLGLSHSKEEDPDQDLPCGLPVLAAERGRGFWSSSGIFGLPVGSSGPC